MQHSTLNNTYVHMHSYMPIEVSQVFFFKRSAMEDELATRDLLY